MSDYILGRGPVPRSGWEVLHRGPSLRPRTQVAHHRSRSPERAPALAEIADPEKLLSIFRECASKGQAPGPDGIRYDDVSITEAAAALRQVSASIMAGTYRPYPTRQAKVRKESGGTRTLSIGNVCDRVVAAAVHRGIADHVDQHLLPGCYGYRPGQSILRMLADMALTVQAENRCWIVTDDIRDAFPSVPLADAIADYARIISDEGVLWLVERVLRGAEGQARTVGIDQGCAVSPLTLNLRLNHCLDRPFTAGLDNPPWYRWADDLVYLCRGAAECHQAIGQAADLLRPAGFELKGVGRPINLQRQGAKIEILGFYVSLGDGRLRLGIPPSAWTQLQEKLERAWGAERPCELAYQILRGWLMTYGLAVGGAEAQEVARRALDTAAQTGFREVGFQTGAAEVMRSSLRRWGAELWLAYLRRVQVQSSS